MSQVLPSELVWGKEVRLKVGCKGEKSSNFSGKGLLVLSWYESFILKQLILFFATMQVKDNWKLGDILRDLALFPFLSKSTSSPHILDNSVKN